MFLLVFGVKVYPGTLSMAASFSLAKPLTPCLRLSSSQHAYPPDCRRGLPPVRAATSSGKGFGAKKERQVPKKAPRQPAKERADEERAVSQILEKLEAEGAASSVEGLSTRQGSKKPPPSPSTSLSGRIDPRLASQGRVDYARVEGWEPHAKGGPKSLEEISPEDLGDLPVRSFSAGASLAPGEGKRRPPPREGVPASGEGGSSEAASQPLPLYEDLVRYLQLLDSKGEISVARPKGAAPLPPFEKWSFGDERFLQYLVDLRCVHSALESAISQATAAQEKMPASPDQAHSDSTKTSPLAGFGPALGLQRSDALGGDVAAIRAALADASESKGQPLPQLSDVATTQAQAHASYISSIARGLAREPEAGAGEGLIRKQKGSAVSASQRAELRLVANLFALYIANLTTGMRIGAKAMECVPVMRQARAVRFFQEYPDHVDDPLKVFTRAVDDLGLRLTEEERDVLKEELPKGVVKTSLLLSVLAVEATVAAS